MDYSTSSSSVTYNTEIPVGYVFKPDEDQIYSYFIPTRIRSMKPVYGVEEIDIYGDKSPDELFGKRDLTKHIYLFTRLKKEKETHTRIRRTFGGGTWLGQKPTPCRRVVNGKEITIGTMRQFTYKGGKQEWIMHEYCIEDGFLNYMIYGRRTSNHSNPDNIVLCHIYNKKAKKGNEIKINNEEINQQKKRKRNSNNHDEDNHENVDDGSNNNGVSSVQNQVENTAPWMPNHNYDPQLLIPEPQEYDWPNNVDQAQLLVPQGGDDFFMMQNYGHGDQEFIVPEPTYYPPPTLEPYNEGGDELFTFEELMSG